MTVGEFFALATCYAESTGPNWPGADIDNAESESLRMNMKTKMLKVLRYSWTVCLSVLIASPSARADQTASDIAQCRDLGSATVGGIELKCASGLFPFVTTGNLKGTLDVPLGKVSFTGGQVQLGYCGYPIPGKGPSLVEAEKTSGRCNSVSSIEGPNGLRLSCASNELPFILKGSAEGKLRTSKGMVLLHGNDNEVALCLVPAKSR